MTTPAATAPAAKPALTWTPHPVIKVPTREQLMAIIAANPPDVARAKIAEIHSKREASIKAEKADPLRFGFVPPMFAKAFELLAKYNLLWLIGSNREGKTYFAILYAIKDMVEHPGRLWAFYHTTEKSSINQQQNKVHAMLPPEWRDLGKVGEETYVKWTKMNGFTNGQFILPNGSMGIFFNYKQDPDVIEGYELDGVWFDEMVPIEFVETAQFRLGRDKELKILVTFTPKHGYTPTVGKAILGAKVLESAPAKLLAPDVKHHPECPPGHMPVVLQCKNPDAAVLMFHIGGNPYGAGEKLAKVAKNEPLPQIKIRAYGWADKIIGSALPKYSPVHRITRAEWERIAERGVCRYRVADPGDTKNWFIKWYGVTPDNKTILYREWPNLERYGEWALPPTKAMDLAWRQGPAQRMEAGRGMAEYRKLILGLEGWQWDSVKKVWIPGKERIQRSIIDPTMGGRAVPGQDEGTSIVGLMREPVVDAEGRELVPAMEWEEGERQHVAMDVQLLQDAMDYDQDRPVDITNCPKFYVVDDLAQSDLAYREFTGLGGEKDALKDIIDPDRYFLRSGYGYVEPEMFRPRRQTYY